MARSPSVIRPRVKDARLYEKAVRASFLDPMFAAVQARLANVVAVNQVWAVMDDIVRRVEAKPYGGVPINEVTRSIRRMEGWHRDRVIKSFRAALGVDIRPLLAEPAINEFMRAKLTENVDLIRRLPDRARESFRKRLLEYLETRPFDQAAVKKAVREELKVSGGRLKLITRDQSAKSIGQLTEIRQRQLHVSQYEWLDSGDIRVRPTHAANNGQPFDWSDPPATGHPGQDFQCRCVAIPIIPAALAATYPKAR